MKEVVILNEIVLKCETEKHPTHQFLNIIGMPLNYSLFSRS